MHGILYKYVYKKTLYLQVTTYALREDYNPGSDTDYLGDPSVHTESSITSPFPKLQVSTMDNDSCNNVSFVTSPVSPISSALCPPPPTNTPRTASSFSKKWTMVDSAKFISVGQVLGDVAMLEGGNANFYACCETGVKVFRIPRQEVLHLLQERPVLEERLWKHRGINVATMLLERLLEYKVREVGGAGWWEC